MPQLFVPPALQLESIWRNFLKRTGLCHLKPGVMIPSVRAEWLRNRAGVLGERNFRRFYVGFVTSLLGSSMSTVAIFFLSALAQQSVVCAPYVKEEIWFLFVALR